MTRRGLNRAAIFCDDRDQGHWVELLGELPERSGVIVRAYVLMTISDPRLNTRKREN